MSPQSATPSSLPGAYRRLLSESPWLAESLIPGESAEFTTPQAMAERAVMDRIVAAAGRRFPMGNITFEMHMWWFTLLAAVCKPAIAVMVEEEVVCDLDLSQGRLFFQSADDDDAQADAPWFWCGLVPTEPTHPASHEEWLTALRHQGQVFATSLSPLVTALGEGAGLKPAPLWAHVTDAIADAAAGAANNSFAVPTGIALAQALLAGVKAEVGEKLVRDPRFINVTDDEILAVDLAHDDLDAIEHLAVRRMSCCMIYHHAGTNKCVSCPHKTPAEKDEDLLRYRAQLF
ncbi:(2Fe-2S)-binding protein [Corynebacterium choanae]|uniref:Ferric siderophore reductase C-terminal domain-containing protein n=1 Tax=Corynebacterium choanae TaxID=1862358 RepID=A0A3G6J5Q9_9CORY|nr:(2Fe-2S)-binding protein [Corynebacterium choanae]AZA13276.1 hypothetical protein CCHOA_04335 [Corynebacterium choanae]